MEKPSWVKLSDEQVEMVKRYRKEGLTVYSISDKMNITIAEALWVIQMGG